MCIVARARPFPRDFHAGESCAHSSDCHLLFYPVWMTPVANPTASPPKGTAKTARPRMNQMSTPPNADFSYLALCASLYFFASSTQHSLLSFIARDGIVVVGGEMRCLAGGATGKDRVGPGIARAANEARARGRTRATAPAGSIAATMRERVRVLRAMKDTLDRLAFSWAKKLGGKFRTLFILTASY